MVADADRPQRFASIIDSLRPAGSPPPTPSEMTVGYLIIVEGLSREDAAEQWGVATRTVDTHMWNLAKRLDIAGGRALRRAVTEELWRRLA